MGNYGKMHITLIGVPTKVPEISHLLEIFFNFLVLRKLPWKIIDSKILKQERLLH